MVDSPLRPSQSRQVAHHSITTVQSKQGWAGIVTDKTLGPAVPIYGVNLKFSFAVLRGKSIASGPIIGWQRCSSTCHVCCPTRGAADVPSSWQRAFGPESAVQELETGSENHRFSSQMKESLNNHFAVRVSPAKAPILQ